MVGAMTRQARRWRLVVPVKALDDAKSRLALSLPMTSAQRAELALAFACDTVEAALDCGQVADVLVVTDDAVAAGALADLGAAIVPERSSGGLNAAIDRAVSALPSRDGVAVLLADLPALTSRSLGLALRRAAGHPVAFVADAAGSGTTLLAASSADLLTPRFGAGSAAAHQALGAHRIAGSGLERLRRDVDVAADLRAAVALGVGSHTARAIGLHAGTLVAPVLIDELAVLR